jgi:hypothetical protein
MMKGGEKYEKQEIYEGLCLDVHPRAADRESLDGVGSPELWVALGEQTRVPLQGRQQHRPIRQ